jgi:hypothetical protein
MVTCPNCGGVLWKRERGILRDVEFCLTCGFTCEAPGTGLTLATAISAFVLGLAISAKENLPEGGQRQG